MDYDNIHSYLEHMIAETQQMNCDSMPIRHPGNNLFEYDFKHTGPKNQKVAARKLGIRHPVNDPIPLKYKLKKRTELKSAYRVHTGYGGGKYDAVKNRIRKNVRSLGSDKGRKDTKDTSADRVAATRERVAKRKADLKASAAKHTADVAKQTADREKAANIRKREAAAAAAERKRNATMSDRTRSARR